MVVPMFVHFVFSCQGQSRWRHDAIEIAVHSSWCKTFDSSIEVAGISQGHMRPKIHVLEKITWLGLGWLGRGAKPSLDSYLIVAIPFLYYMYMCDTGVYGCVASP